MTNPIGLNLVSPGFTRDSMAMPLKAWNPKTIVVNEIDDAIWAREILPNAVIGLRLMPDNAIQEKWTVNSWLQKWSMYIPLLIEHNIHAVSGNEPNGYGENLSAVIQFETTLAYELATLGVGGMFCRWPVGHVQEGREHELRPLANAIRAYDKHFYMTNEYAINTQPLLEQRYFVGRFQNVFDAVGPLPTIIGEISVNTPDRDDPGKQDSWSGWRSSYDGEIEPFINALKLMWERIYEPAGVHSMCVFLVGGAPDQHWQNLANGQTQWAVWVNAMAGYRPALSPPPIVIDEPAIKPDDTQEIEPIPEPIEEKEPMSKRSIILTALVVIALLLVGGVFVALAGVPGTGVGELLTQSIPVVADASGPISTEQGRQLIEDVTNTSLIGGAAIGALVLLIVQGLKYLPIAWLQRRTATDMATGVATILLLAGAVFSETSYAGTFDNSVAFMESVAPLILGLLMAVTTSGGIFNGLKRVGVSEASFLGKRAAV